MVTLLTEFVMPGSAAVSADDIDVDNSVVSIDTAAEGLLVAAIPDIL